MGNNKTVSMYIISKNTLENIEYCIEALQVTEKGYNADEISVLKEYVNKIKGEKKVQKMSGSKFLWYIKQLLPLTYRSRYTEDG